MIAHAGRATNPNDFINRCPNDDCHARDASPAEQRADKAMRRVADLGGRQVKALPDVMFVHVVTGDDNEGLSYTIIRNKTLSNNSMLFGESRRRILDDDTLTVVKGYTGSYPNAFSRIPIDQIEVRIDLFLRIKDKLDYYNYAKQHGIQRNSPGFWAESDWHHRQYLKGQPVKAGVFDLYRYHRIAEKVDKTFTW